MWLFEIYHTYMCNFTNPTLPASFGRKRHYKPLDGPLYLVSKPEEVKVPIQPWVQRTFNYYITLFSGNLTPTHYGHRNANNIEQYTFVMLFVWKFDTLPPLHYYVTLEWSHNCVSCPDSVYQRRNNSEINHSYISPRLDARWDVCT